MEKYGSRGPKQTTHAEHRRKRNAKTGQGPTGVTHRTDRGRRKERKPGLGSGDRAPVLWGWAQQWSRRKTCVWHNLEPPQPLGLLWLPTTACPAVMAGVSTVLSTKPHSWMPGRRADISRALGNGPGPMRHPQRLWLLSLLGSAARLDGMVGVGDVGLFGSQRWRETRRFGESALPPLGPSPPQRCCTAQNSIRAPSPGYPSWVQDPPPRSCLSCSPQTPGPTQNFHRHIFATAKHHLERPSSSSKCYQDATPPSWSTSPCHLLNLSMP